MKKTRIAIVVLLVVAAAYGACFMVLFCDPSPSPPPRYTILVNEPNVFAGGYLDETSHLAVSPNEQWMVYAAFRSGNALYVSTLDIHVYDLRSDTDCRVATHVENEANVPERLATHMEASCWLDEGLAFPWEPSGYAKGFLRGRVYHAVVVADSCEMRMIESDSLQWTCGSPSERARAIGYQVTRNSIESRAWNGDRAGSSVYRATWKGSNEQDQIAILERIEANGNAVELTRRRSRFGGWEIQSLSISPGERYVAYLAREYSHWDYPMLALWPVRPRDIRLFIVDTQTGIEYALGAAEDLHSATWTQDGKALYFIERNKGICRIRMDELDD
ncbi:MAG: hypothetical protein OEX18_13940 [Candidatus Krumholzibacteria bacterium]|nr:hypothetical protein [Candidatus Krumholzibacteria bacterium]MDH4338369.1 hypothetical protein [Candidatus Krumholzibacteria bacterium]MDH5271395.1 hypothetical protein [Candidatus Krumholzibacteria bacterium]